MKKIRYDEQNQLIVWSDANAKRTSITALFVKEKEPSTLALADVVDVKRGIETDVLLKGGLLDPNCCLSLVAKERTLDLVFDNVSERDAAFRGLQAILSSLDMRNVNFS